MNLLYFIIGIIAIILIMFAMYFSCLLYMDRQSRRKVFEKQFEKGYTMIENFLDKPCRSAYYRLIDEKFTYLFNLKYANKEKLEVLNNRFKEKYKDFVHPEDEICEFSPDSVFK